MRKQKRFSLAARILGGVCTMLLLGALIVFVSHGPSIATSVLLVAALSGLVAPCVSAGDSLLEVLGATLGLIVEGVATLIEAILDIFASIFG